MGLLGLQGFDSVDDVDEEDKPKKKEKASLTHDKNKGKEGRNLIANAVAVDWFAKGFTSGVKSQGSCGSCWAFAVNTVSETTLAIKANKQYPTRLSEQQLVDCTMNTTDN